MNSIPSEKESVSTTSEQQLVALQDQCGSHNIDPVIDQFISLSESHNVSLLKSLDEIIYLLYQIIDKPELGALWVSIISAATGAFSAFIFNFIYGWHLNKRQEQSNLTGAINDSLTNLESTACPYWLEGYEEVKKNDVTTQEIRIKSELAILRKLFDIYKPTVKRKNKAVVESDINKFIDQSYDLITGEEFESIDRLPSKSKAIKIAALLATARMKILPRVLRITK